MLKKIKNCNIRDGGHFFLYCLWPKTFSYVGLKFIQALIILSLVWLSLNLFKLSSSLDGI